MRPKPKEMWSKILGYQVGDKVRLKEQIDAWFGVIQVVVPKGTILTVRKDNGKKVEISWRRFYASIDACKLELVEEKEMKKDDSSEH